MTGRRYLVEVCAPGSGIVRSLTLWATDPHGVRSQVEALGYWLVSCTEVDA